MRTWIDDLDAQSLERTAAAHQRAESRLAVGGEGDAVGVEFGAASAEDSRRLLSAFAGNQQSRFGQAVAGQERLAAKSATGERLGESVQRLGPDRLGPVEGDRPAAQVETQFLLVRDLPRAQVVREVRSPADRRPRPRNGLQPAHGALEKRDGRHQRAAAAAVERLNHSADQPHVVKQREPEHATAFWGRAKALLDQGGIMKQVFMSDHHSLGGRRRARRILQEREVAAARAGVAPGAGQAVREGLGAEPLRVGEPGDLLQPPPGRRQLSGGGQQRGGPRILHHGAQPVHRPVWSRQRGGDRHRAGIQTTEEGRDELKAGRKDQQDPLSLQSP